MNNCKHPGEFIAPELVAAMRNVAAEAEQLKQLHPVQLAIIHEEKWFQLFVPKQYDGLALQLPNALQMEEALAWTDGSVGWTVTLCAGAGWFVGFFDPGTAASIFNNPTVCLAGSGKTTGIAKVTNGGYEITGKWDYATGANHATAFTANCMIEENNVLLKNADGSPVIIPFIFFNAEVTDF
jgi:alkylation response protein AidB-like acyl-CoA dehydrogenase